MAAGRNGRLETVTAPDSKTHLYNTTVLWKGNRGEGTRTYRSYGRDHDIASDGRPTLQGTSDAAFNGDPSRWNPELLLLASASECHMLWYLQLASMRGVVVTGYEDAAEGRMAEENGGGRFVDILLRPSVTVTDASMAEIAQRLHKEASTRCFIANSLNFEVRHEPRTRVDSEPWHSR
jgi:organic hydroperoxide reductase OsmC/OhrA